MNTKKKLIALIVAGLIIIALIIYFIFFFDFNKSATPGPGGEEGNQPSATPVTAVILPPSGAQRTPEEQARDQVTQLGMSFAERYGSSSNQAEFSNLVDLEIFMTPSLQAQTREYIAAEQAKNEVPAEYEGVTTKAVVVIINSITSDSADVTVQTKRREENTRGETKNYNQDLKLTMKKTAENWQVDSAVWQ